MTRRTVEAVGAGVRLVGWVEGEGPRVVLLHGGPGLSHDYLDGLLPELVEGYAVASYQQRGLPPSSEDGPFRVSDQVSDIALFLDAMGWDSAILLGHSWGGHLAMHASVAIAGRIDAVLAVDTWGAVGDGGSQEFEAALMARTPLDDARRLAELDALEERGEGTVEEMMEGLRLIWPAYFATRAAAPPMPDIRLSGPCYARTMQSAKDEMAALEAALPSIRVPFGFLVGGESPMPVTASTDAADRISGASTEIVPNVGHFVWMEAPGRVRSALDRLVHSRETGSEHGGSAG